MGELKWSVVLDNGVTFSGTVPGEGVVSIVCELPAGRIRSVTADMKLNVGGDDRVFVNGFQSWTYSPEYSANDRIRAIMEKFGADLKHEVLAESITYDGADDTAYTKEWTVNGEKVTLAVKKI